DHVVGDGIVVAVGDTRRAGHDGHDLRREASEVVARLLVRDLVDLPELPHTRQASDLRLGVRGRVAGERGRLVALGLGHAGLEAPVDEEAPDLFVRNPRTHELLDVDAAIPERTALAIGLADLRLDRDDTLEPRLELNGLAHR